LSASDNLIAPPSPILSSVLSEKDKEQQLLREITREVRDVFDLSASHNLDNASVSISFPILSENDRKKLCY
jgi:hypothetical protein